MKLNKLRQDLIDLLKDSNLSEQTIDMVFMEFEANNSITIRRPRFADDMNDEELLAYIADKDKIITSAILASSAVTTEDEIQLGDTIEIVEYGHLMWENVNSDTHFRDCASFKKYKTGKDVVWFDTNPGLVGLHAIITKIYNGSYALEFVKGGSQAWFSPKQLKLIKKGSSNG